MPLGRLIVLLLILVAVVLVVVVRRRGSAQRDTHRVEAGALRAEAPRREYEATAGRDPGAEVSPSTSVDPVAATDSAEAESPVIPAERHQTGEAGPSAAVAAAAGPAVSAGDTSGAEDASDESERIASAVDFRDDTPVDPAPEPTPDRTEVFPSSDAGSETDMDEHQSTETEHRSTPAADLSHEADAATDEAATEHAPAEAGAAVVETTDIDRSAAELAQEPAEERYDPTPTRDWAADEGELLEETHERGERLEEERAELAQQAGDGAADAAAPDDAGDHSASDGTADAAASDDTATTGRRISAFEELRDGGFGVGSAAPLDDGAQPLDHPVQAYRDTMTYRVPGDAGYDSAQPHLWFYDEGAAERSGFRRADG